MELDEHRFDQIVTLWSQLCGHCLLVVNVMVAVGHGVFLNSTFAMAPATLTLRCNSEDCHHEDSDECSPVSSSTLFRGKATALLP